MADDQLWAIVHRKLWSIERNGNRCARGTGSTHSGWDAIEELFDNYCTVNVYHRADETLRFQDFFSLVEELSKPHAVSGSDVQDILTMIHVDGVRYRDIVRFMETDEEVLRQKGKGHAHRESLGADIKPTSAGPRTLKASAEPARDVIKSKKMGESLMANFRSGNLQKAVDKMESEIEIGVLVFEKIKDDLHCSLQRTAFAGEKNWPDDEEAICKLGLEMTRRIESAKEQLDDALERGKENREDLRLANTIVELRQNLKQLEELRDKYCEVLDTSLTHERQWKAEIGRLKEDVRHGSGDPITLEQKVEDMEHRHQALLAQLHSLRRPGGTDAHRAEALQHLMDIVNDASWWKRVNSDLHVIQMQFDKSLYGKDKKRENRAAAAIQSQFRGMSRRFDSMMKSKAATMIQAKARGSQARQQCRASLEEAEDLLNVRGMKKKKKTIKANVKPGDAPKHHGSSLFKNARKSVNYQTRGLLGSK